MVAKKYPFPPELLDSLPEGLAELYRELELTLLKEICSRLKIRDQLNEVTVVDIKALRSHGIELEEIKKAIAKTAGVSEKHVDELLDDVVKRNQQYYSGTLTQLKVTEPDQIVDKSDIEAIRQQTQDEFHNLTASLGFLVDGGQTMLPATKSYQWALDSAVMQVESGAINYNEAISNAVTQLAKSGLKRIDYESGHVDSADVAARRAIMTGVNQLNQRYREQSMELMQTDLVETTAHQGARDVDGAMGWENHKRWQGKVYRWKKLSERYPGASKSSYPDFEETCGYGDVTGIGGANCRHSYYPFVEGVSERTYTDEELASIDPPPFEYEGRTYTAYEATQKQRQIERAIRRQKALKTAYKAAGDGKRATAANIKLRRLKGKYTEFSAAAGLPEQPERVKIYKNLLEAQNG